MSVTMFKTLNSSFLFCFGLSEMSEKYRYIQCLDVNNRFYLKKSLLQLNFIRFC